MAYKKCPECGSFMGKEGCPRNHERGYSPTCPYCGQFTNANNKCKCAPSNFAEIECSICGTKFRAATRTIRCEPCRAEIKKLNENRCKFNPRRNA